MSVTAAVAVVIPDSITVSLAATPLKAKADNATVDVHLVVDDAIVVIKPPDFPAALTVLAYGTGEVSCSSARADRGTRLEIDSTSPPTVRSRYCGLNSGR